MKKFNSIVLAVLCIFSFQAADAQLCDGVKGPNLLAVKGSFSAPYIKVNTTADPCLSDGSSTFNPEGNVGQALTDCSDAVGDIIPCTDYVYKDQENGMMPEFTYSLLKVMGDANGSNCIHSPIWKAKDHSNDGGYFLAVNGAPNTNYSPLFYQIKRIPVCIGTTYEFSAWVISMIPRNGGTDAASPNISFVVNGEVIATSGKIPYNNIGKWIQVGGSFTATTDYVNLQVINATSVAGGNDLGLDDISIRVCASRIDVSGPETTVDGDLVTSKFVVSDPLGQNRFYRWEISTDGGNSFTKITLSDSVKTYDADNTFTLNYPLASGRPVREYMNGWIYRLVVSTSEEALDNPDCIYFNDYKLIVKSEESGPTPVKLVSFNGTYSGGVANLDWQTSQEINSDRFELFRSNDGNDFVLAGTVAAAGNSYAAVNYSYQDRISGSAGNHVFYKLKQIDKNGKFTFSSVIKLNLDDVAASFQLYPNPVVNNFTASFSAPKTGSATLVIRNTNGQTVYSKSISVLKGNNAVVIHDAPLKTGMYYVSIANDDIHYNGKLQKK